MTRRAWTVVFIGALALGAGATAACGSSGRGSSGAAVDACHLLTTQEAASALQVDPITMARPQAIDTGGGPGDSTCEFATRPDSGSAVGSTLSVRVYQQESSDSARAAFAQFRNLARDPRTVNGVGQAAYQDSGGCGDLTVLAGDRLLQLSLISSQQCSPGLTAALVTASREAVIRM